MPAAFVLLSVLAFHTAPVRDVSRQKIWMDSDVPWLRANAPVSIVGSLAAFAPPAAAPTGPYVKELDTAWYRQQIDSLQSQIDAASARIRALQAAQYSGTGISGAIPLNQSMTIDAATTITNLQISVKQLAAQIDSLQDLARRNSIAPGAIL